MAEPLSDRKTFTYEEVAMLYDAVSGLYEKKRDDLARAIYLERPERTIASLQRRFDEVDRLHSKIRSVTMEMGSLPAGQVLRVS